MTHSKADESFDISVVIPTFERKALLPRALDSVYKQTIPAREVIVVDDGSRDATAAMIGERYPDVKYIYQSRGGVSRARNVGLEKATGEWLALLDSDDEWLPGKLAAQCQALSRSREFKLCHTNEIWIRNGKRVNPKLKHQKSGGWIYQKCLPLCVISPSSVLIHRSVFEEVGCFDETLPACEDYDLWLRVCARFPVLYVDKPLVIKYGGHDDQLSKKYWGMDRFRISAMEKMLAGDDLDRGDRASTVSELRAKLRIVMMGAYKFDNQAMIAACRRKLQYYERTRMVAAIT